MSQLNPNAPSFSVPNFSQPPMQQRVHYNGAPNGDPYNQTAMYDGAGYHPASRGYGGGNGGGNGPQYYGNYGNNGSMGQPMPGGYGQQSRGGRGGRHNSGPQMHYQNPNMVGNSNMHRANNQHHLYNANSMDTGTYEPQHQRRAGASAPMGWQQGSPTTVGNPAAQRQYQNSSPPASAPTPMVPTTPVPSYAAKPVQPKVVLIVGYKQSGKTSIAKEIARREQFEYVSLLEHVSEAEQEEDLESSAKARMKPLRAILEKKGTFKGLVLDDAIITNRFEALYISHYVKMAGLQLDAMVAVMPDLITLTKRGVDFEAPMCKVAHPESFEFAYHLEGPSVVAVTDDLPLKTLVDRVAGEVSAVLREGHPPLELQVENFMPNCPMVTDLDMVEEILDAELSTLVAELPFSFTYSEPNYVLQYLQFVSIALQLQHYLITPWIYGDKVSLIGYKDKVYIHLTSYNLVFQLTDIPAAVEELMTKLTAEAAEEAKNAEDAPKVLFSVEATMLDDILYISDMMVIGKQLGSEMLLHDRVKLLEECFGKLPVDGPIRLLEHFPVSEIKTCLEKYEQESRGVLFVNPDGLECGRYDSRNYIYPTEEKKTVRIRVWEGQVTDGSWMFKGYVRNEDEEVLAVASGPRKDHLPVVIPDSAVSEYVINDGNIIECVLEKSTSKGKAKDKGSVLSFRRRSKWGITPITQYFQWAFVEPPRWPTDSFFDACSTIPTMRPS